MCNCLIAAASPGDQDILIGGDLAGVGGGSVECVTSLIKAVFRGHRASLHEGFPVAFARAPCPQEIGRAAEESPFPSHGYVPVQPPPKHDDASPVQRAGQDCGRCW